MDNTISKLRPGPTPQVERNESKPLAGETREKPGSTNFLDILGDRLDLGLPKKIESKSGAELAELKFSAHAKARLSSRGIELSGEDILKMQQAVQKMSEKGAKESLILTDKAAFVVSVKNNTVITAVDRDSMKENVFTNIDSTMMI
jgi:flagellar operon protein